MSKFTTFYLVVSAALVLFYAYSTARGWEYGHPGKEKTTEEAKRSGHRGGHFLFIHAGGLRGGK